MRYLVTEHATRNLCLLLLTYPTVPKIYCGNVLFLTYQSCINKYTIFIDLLSKRLFLSLVICIYCERMFNHYYSNNIFEQ